MSDFLADFQLDGAARDRILANPTVGIHRLGADGVVLWANDAELQMVGRNRDEYVGQHITSFYVDPGRAGEFLSRLRSGEAIRNFEATVRHKDGSSRHLLIDSSLYEERPGSNYAISFTRDLTDEMAAEQQLRFLDRATEVLASSLDYETTLGDLAWLIVPALADWFSLELLDGDGELRSTVLAHAQPGLLELAAELRQKGRLEFLREASVRVVASGAAEFCEDVTLVARASDREAIELLGIRSAVVAPLLAEDRRLGTITLCSGSSRPCGERQLEFARELAARAAVAIDNARAHTSSEQSRRELYERWLQLPEAAVVLDADGRVHLSLEAGELFGLSAQAIHTVYDLPIYRPSGVHWAEQGMDPLSAVASSGQAQRALECQVRASNSSTPILANIGPFNLGQGRGAIMLFQPIDQIRLLDATKTDFMRLLSHELRHPLATAKLALELAKEASSVDEMSKLLVAAEEQVETMDELVTFLTEVVRAGQDLVAIAAEPWDMRDLVAENELALASAARLHRLELHLAEEPCPVGVDPHRIVSVLTNLVSNAGRHAPAGTAIRIFVERDASGVKVAVIDEGPGVPEGAGGRVFEQYFRGARPGSMGLGLFLARRILEYHDGEIWCEEGPPGRFYLRLPLRERGQALV